MSSIRGIKEEDVSLEAEFEDAAVLKGDGRLGRNNLLAVPLGITDLLEGNAELEPTWAGFTEEEGALYLVPGSRLEDVDAVVGTGFLRSLVLPSLAAGEETSWKYWPDCFEVEGPDGSLKSFPYWYSTSPSVSS